MTGSGTDAIQDIGAERFHTRDRRRGEATAAALTGLRDALSQGVLRPGASVIEEEWAERLSVSRTPVRAAIGALVAEGLLVKRGRQVHVFQPSLADLVDVYEIRRALEGLAASLALRFNRIALSAALQHHFSLLRSTQGSPEWFSHHEQFHMALVEACGNRRLIDMIRSLRLQSEPYVRYAVNADAKFRNRAMTDHRQMVAVVRRGDEAALRQLIEGHLEGTLDELHRLLALTEGYGVTPLLAAGVGEGSRR